MTSNDNPPQAIVDVVHSMRDLAQRAAQQYRPVVDDILRTGGRDVQHIERTLDGLLDFCWHEPVILIYQQLCRHYWQFDQMAARSTTSMPTANGGTVMSRGTPCNRRSQTAC